MKSYRGVVFLLIVFSVFHANIVEILEHDSNMYISYSKEKLPIPSNFQNGESGGILHLTPHIGFKLEGLTKETVRNFQLGSEQSDQIHEVVLLDYERIDGIITDVSVSVLSPLEKENIWLNFYIKMDIESEELFIFLLAGIPDKVGYENKVIFVNEKSEPYGFWGLNNILVDEENFQKCKEIENVTIQEGIDIKCLKSFPKEYSVSILDQKSFTVKGMFEKAFAIPIGDKNIKISFKELSLDIKYF